MYIEEQKFSPIKAQPQAQQEQFMTPTGDLNQED